MTAAIASEAMPWHKKDPRKKVPDVTTRSLEMKDAIERDRLAEENENRPRRDKGLSENPGPLMCPEFRQIADQLPFGILILRSNFSVETFNATFANMFAYEFKTLPDIGPLFEKAVKKPLMRSMLDPISGKKQTGGRFETVISIESKERGRRLCHIHVFPLTDGRLLTTCDDFTERRRIESEMQYSKVDSVSLLIGGLALIMDDIVKGIQGLSTATWGQEPPVSRQLQAVEEEARSGREFLLRIQTFNGGRTKEAKSADLNEIIRKTSTIFTNTRQGITVRRNLEERLWAVEADRIQLEKMLIHLYMYLQQASPDSGELQIETENMVLPGNASIAYRVNPGRYVRVTLAGQAMPKGLPGRPKALRLSSLMNETGLRDSLGITFALCFIQSHGGVMTVGGLEESMPVMQILLPATGTPALETPARCAARSSGGTILLVDDDAVLIELNREILEAAGYRVLVACSGREALEVHEMWKGDIDLIMLDMIMPSMGGAETFRELKKRDPRVSVIIISGYSLPDEVCRLLEEGCRGFLQKPFQAPALLKKIRQVMGGQDGSGRESHDS
jgi:two-component system cell cycle sensor histidine kinase/response regulator CckA